MEIKHLNDSISRNHKVAVALLSINVFLLGFISWLGYVLFISVKSTETFTIIQQNLAIEPGSGDKWIVFGSFITVQVILLILFNRSSSRAEAAAERIHWMLKLAKAIELAEKLDNAILTNERVEKSKSEKSYSQPRSRSIQSIVDSLLKVD